MFIMERRNVCQSRQEWAFGGFAVAEREWMSMGLAHLWLGRQEWAFKGLAVGRREWMQQRMRNKNWLMSKSKKAKRSEFTC